MTESPDIERIVRDVLRRLEQDSAGADSGGAASRGSASGGSASAHTSAHDASGGQSGALVVHDRVVSLPQLEGRLEGVRRLQVAPSAVVTPSVRDLLRQRGIELCRDGAGRPGDDAVWRMALPEIRCSLFAAGPENLASSVRGERTVGSSNASCECL